MPLQAFTEMFTILIVKMHWNRMKLLFFPAWLFEICYNALLRAHFRTLNALCTVPVQMYDFNFHAFILPKIC